MAPALTSAGTLAGSGLPFVSEHRRAPPRNCRPPTATRQEPAANGVDNPIVITIPPRRSPTAPPEPVPVIHSAAYMIEVRSAELKVRKDVVESSDDVPSTTSRYNSIDEEDFQGNAIEWALARADESLTEMEKNPSPATEAIWRVSQSPVGEAAGRGIRSAARLTVTAGAEALKIAAPVGAWAFKKGLKAAVGLVTIMASDSKKKKGELTEES